jgi:uncharacterized repeat protein (TIGR01451 family)
MRSRLTALFNIIVVVGAVVVLGLVGSPVAFGAAPESAGWAVDQNMTPSVFTAASSEKCETELAEQEPKCDTYVITATNVGAIAAARAPVVVKDVLPAGLTAREVTFHWSGFPTSFGGRNANLAAFGLCTAMPVASGTPVRCELPPELFGLSLPSVAPGDTLVMRVLVTVDEATGPRDVTNETVVEGGGAPPATLRQESSIEGPEPGFGPSAFTAGIYGADGQPDTQAGSHPAEFTTTIDLKNKFRIAPDSSAAVGDTTVEDLKDVAVNLPLGFLGSALAAPTCTFRELSSHISAGVGGCPSDSIVGHIETYPEKADSANGPIYNMVPEHGTAAEFGYVDSIPGAHVLYANVIPGPEGYVLQTIAKEIPQVALTHIAVTFFGDPAEHAGSDNTPIALFTNPGVCSGRPLTTTIYMDSWQHPGPLDANGAPITSDSRWATSSSESPPVTGCNTLAFEPREFRFQPETGEADHATGAEFEIEVPQPEDPSTLATPPLKSAIVTLPAGMIVNPAAAGGLQACTVGEIGWVGPGTSLFNNEAPSCPAASKIGSVAVTSPQLAGTLVGSVYLAAQDENPFDSLLAGYIVIDDPITGVLVKIAGRLELDSSTGQITGRFTENPQLPFKTLRLSFFGGARGELATPEACGSYSTSGSFSSWAGAGSLETGLLSDGFSITSDCQTGFAPSFVAGTTSSQAGAYSPIVLSFSRGDSEPDLAGLTVSLPAGLLAKLKGVALCPDAALAAAATRSGSAETASPSCPEASKIGTVLAGAGAGADPFFLPGQAYLAGPYKGAPYSVGVVVPALAGPFDLGTVVVRQALHVDPTDSHVTDISDPLPTIIDARGQDGGVDGFPVRLRRVEVSINRPSFALNPTSCNPLSITASLLSTTGGSSSSSTRFATSGCRELAFKPKFSASTAGKASKANGASLDVKVGYPTGPLGSYANIKAVKVDLPKQLPSRLTTLQKACLAATFEANPANCPAASNVGSATAVTPILNAPLTGPAYLVSHGGEAFPDLEIVLQGENNLELVLVGNTQIKNGITSSTFKAVPDAPVSSFELKLPTGKFSILGANVPQSKKYSLCGQSLPMPTMITAQNGAVIKQTTKIAVTGCPKGKKTKKAKGKKKAGAKGKAKK